MKSPKIISIGEVLWDLFPEGERFGGAPANFACHAAKYGGEVTMVSAVGNDDQGSRAVAILGEFGIETSLVQVMPDAPTGIVGLELDAVGKPRFTIPEKSAWDQIAWTPQLAAKITAADAVYFGTLGQRGKSSRDTIRRALESARSAGIPRILDINLRAPFFSNELIRESIACASVLKLSDDELESVTNACRLTPTDDHESTLRILLEHFQLDSIVMTRGAKGALFVSNDETCEHPGIPTKVVDTVGAGDSFTASFVLGLLRGASTSTILREACETASVVCSKPGAIPDSFTHPLDPD